jgi:hypothetical protein
VPPITAGSRLTAIIWVVLNIRTIKSRRPP